MPQAPRKPLIWVESAKKDLMAFPPDVQDVMGRALLDAQYGGKHPDAKPLTGFGGAGVLEAVDDFDGDTYRTVYTVKLEGVVYVLHAFQKKSKTGRETPKQEIDKVKARLKRAEDIHRDLRARGQLPPKPPSKRGGPQA
ncbi:MAG: type II toxin-antitoxin system RelE/ParE family toxin [Candidatus Sericytochromatia bacterium]